MKLRLWLATLAATVGIAVASLGSSAASAASSRGSSASALTPVTIGYPSVNAGYANLFVAEDYGIFKKYGLNVKLTLINSSGQLVPALASGTLNIGVGAAPSTAEAILKGENLKFIALSEDVFNSFVYAPVSIKNMQQLKGQNFAVSAPNSVGDFGVTAVLKAYGMKRSDVNVKFIGSVPATMSALKTGAVQAVGLTPPQQAILPPGKFHSIADMRKIPFPLAAYAVTGSYATSHADVIKKFVESQAAALKFLRAHPKQAIASIKKHTETTSAGAKAAYQFFLKVWDKTPAIPTSLLKQGFTIAAQINGGHAPANISKYIFKG